MCLGQSQPMKKTKHKQSIDKGKETEKRNKIMERKERDKVGIAQKKND